MLDHSSLHIYVLIICIIIYFASAAGTLVAFFQGDCSQSSVCQQICVDIDHGYICKCRPGFIIHKDGSSCIGSPSKNSIKDVDPDQISDDLPGKNRNVQTSQSKTQDSVFNSIKTSGTDQVSYASSGSMAGARNNGEKVKVDIGLVGDINPVPLMRNPSCDGIACQNNGSCSITSTVPKCNCHLGYAGKACEKSIQAKYPRFTGDSYLALPVLTNAYKEFDIYIKFKPLRDTGLLLFTAEDAEASKDYLSISLVNGFVEYRFDCGTGHVSLKSKNKVQLGHWNNIKVHRIDNHGSIWLNDKGPISGYSKGAYSRITVRLELYLGGYTNIPAIRPRVNIMKSFVGCVETLIINDHNYDMRKSSFVGDGQHGRNIEDCSDGVCDNVSCQNGGTCIAKSPDQYVCLCELGFFGQHCEKSGVIHVPQFNGHALLQYPGLGRTSLSYTEMDLTFKPENKEGLLLYNGYTDDRKGDYIALLMREGYLEFQFDLGTGPGIIRSIEPVELNAWHKVKVSRTGLQGVLEIDEHSAVQGEARGAFTQLTLLKDLFVGGHPDFDITSKFANLSSSFQGCIQKVVINGRRLHLLEEATFGYSVGRCSHPCVSQPCKHSGVCVPNMGEYTCLCPLGYSDTHCSQEVVTPVTVPVFKGHSYLLYTAENINKRVTGKVIDIQMEFRTDRRNGMLLWTGHEEPLRTGADFLSLGFQDGALQFRFNLGSGDAVISYNKTILHDGKWHSFRAQRNKQDGFLEVDGASVEEGSSPGSYFFLNTNKKVFLGGMPDVAHNTQANFQTGFIGCIRKLTLAEDYQVELLQEAESGSNIKNCQT